MDDIPDGQCTTRFHTCVVLVARNGDDEEIIVGNGNCESTIAHDMRGSNGFGYDPLFEPTDAPGRRMAELTPDEKNAISHRGKALRAMRAKLEEVL
jgi:XTP/dITP diphosphohydrolase